MNGLLQFLGCVVCVSIVRGEFLGGTIFWMFEPASTEVRLIYRLSWKKGTGPCGTGCNESDIGKLGSVSKPSLLPLSWKVVTPASSLKVSDVNYIVTSVSSKNNFDWEHGENRFTVKWSYGDEMKIRFDDIPWILSGNDVKPRFGVMGTIIKYGIRADTKRMNASPYVSIPSVIGIPINCNNTVHIPVEDVDGDVIKCRLAMTSECGNGCTNLPERTFWIDQTSCNITIYSYEDFGYKDDRLYRLSLVVEDYPQYPTTRGSQHEDITENISTVPVQLTIRVINRPCLRRDTLQFVTPTPTHYDRQSYTPRNYIRKVQINSTFFIQGTAGVHISNSEAMVSAPASLHYSYHPDDHGRYNVIKIATKWSPNICDQKGPQQLCVWGIDNFGVTTDPRCITFIIGDDNDYCSLGSAACDNNGKCINVYKEPAERCDCLPGYTSYNCDVVTKCNPNPCRNGTCYEIPPNNFYCLCNVGYKGTTCNYKIPPCSQDPCQNSGICFNVIDNVGNPDFRCHCTQGFTGQKCQDLITTHVTTLPTSSISTYLWSLATSKITVPNNIAMSTPPFTTSRKTITKTPVTSPTTSSSTTTTTASTSTTTTSPMPSTTTTTVPTSTSTTVKTTLATTRSTTPPTTTTSSTTTKTTTQSTTTTTYPTSTTTATLPTTRKPSTAKPSTRSTTATMITTRHVAVATSRRVTTNTPSTVATKISTQNVFTTSYAPSRNITPVCRPNRILNRSQALNDSKSKDKTMFIMYVSIGGVAALSMLVLVPCIIIGCYKRSKNLVKPFNDSETSKGKKKRN